MVSQIKHYLFSFELSLIQLDFEQWLILLDIFKALGNVLRIIHTQQKVVLVVKSEVLSRFRELHEQFLHPCERNGLQPRKPIPSLSLVKGYLDAFTGILIDLVPRILFVTAIHESCLHIILKHLLFGYNMKLRCDNIVLLAWDQLTISEAERWDFHLHSIVVDVDLPEILVLFLVLLIEVEVTHTEVRSACDGGGDVAFLLHALHTAGH